MLPVLLDQFQRPLRNLRLSVTDRCNLRCSYCMPEQDYVWLPREDILQFEEIERLVDVFVDLGVDKVRLTGGEPLLRRDLSGCSSPRWPRRPRIARPRHDDQRDPAGGSTPRPEARRDCTAHGQPRHVAAGPFPRADAVATSSIACSTGSLPRRRIFPRLKLDTVVIRGTNDDELVDLIEFGRRYGAEVRFIEYMDVGGATHWSMDRVVSRDRDARRRWRATTASSTPVVEASSAPGRSLPASRTARYSASSRRRRGRSATTAIAAGLRRMAMWYLCLYASRGTDLRAALRGGASAAELAEMIRSAWNAAARPWR